MTRKAQRFYAILAVVFIVASLGTLGSPIFQAQAGQAASTPLPYPPPQTATPSLDVSPLPYPPPQTVAPPLDTSPLTPPMPTSGVLFLTASAFVPTPTQEPSKAAQAALAYLAQREGIPASPFVVATDHPTEYPSLGRRFQVVTLLDTRPEGKSYDFLVDLDTGKVIEDIASIQRAEEQARIQKYGKLDPALYDRLHIMRDDDVVTVMIRVAGDPTSSISEVQAAAIATVTAKYLEAQMAVERGGKPVDVGDPVLADHIYTDYMVALDIGMAQREQQLAEAQRALAEALEAQGISIQARDGLSLQVTLTKQDILRFEERADVGTISLVEADRSIVLPGAVLGERDMHQWNYWQVGFGLILLTIGLGMTAISKMWKASG